MITDLKSFTEVEDKDTGMVLRYRADVDSLAETIAAVSARLALQMEFNSRPRDLSDWFDGEPGLWIYAAKLGLLLNEVWEAEIDSIPEDDRASYPEVIEDFVNAITHHLLIQDEPLENLALVKKIASVSLIRFDKREDMKYN